ncbi:hypothetical protein HYS97_03695 [Candidatus Daviesbacteria bacterium]|nr:hypothetical protein [Candidatus Daviesbacteria bacterium]
MKKIINQSILNFFKLDKRKKMVIASALLTLSFLYITQTFNVVFRRYYLIYIIGIVSYVLSLWALWMGKDKTRLFAVFILPVTYAIALSSFYFLFRHIGWLTRIPTAAFFGLSFYSLLLSQNVFNVSSDKAIPLYRAASTVNFVFTILTSILLISVLYAFELQFYWNAILVIIVSFFLSLQVLWSIDMDKITSQNLIYSFLMALIAGELALALSFWPSHPIVKAILLSTILYICVEIVIEHIRKRLNRQLVYECIGACSLILFLSYIVTVWGG